MIEHSTFLATAMEQPYEMGPLLVWADWLQERGDPRGDLLALLPEIVAAVKQLPLSPGTGCDDRTDEIKKLRTDPQRRLFAALQARFTPLSDGRTVGDLQTDVRSQRCVTAALLHAAGLAARAAWAAWAAEAARAAWAARAARAAGAAAFRWQLNLAVWLRSRDPLPTQVRRLLRTIHAGVHA